MITVIGVEEEVDLTNFHAKIAFEILGVIQDDTNEKICEVNHNGFEYGVEGAIQQ